MWKCSRREVGQMDMTSDAVSLLKERQDDVGSGSHLKQKLLAMIIAPTVVQLCQSTVNKVKGDDDSLTVTTFGWWCRSIIYHPRNSTHNCKQFLASLVLDNCRFKNVKEGTKLVKNLHLRSNIPSSTFSHFTFRFFTRPHAAVQSELLLQFESRWWTP